jgi:hypothetical protein
MLRCQGLGLLDAAAALNQLQSILNIPTAFELPAWGNRGKLAH